MRASGDEQFLADGPWGQMVAMVDATFRKLATGASWSGSESNHLFLGRGGQGDFLRVSGVSGLDDPGDSMAAVALDFDRDGWMDVALGNISRPRFRLLRNRLQELASLDGQHPGFVAFEFVGGNHSAHSMAGWSPRDAFGTRVMLELPDGTRLHREHSPGNGFKSQHTSRLLVGIGSHDRIREARVIWPSGREQTVTGLRAGGLATLYENPDQSPSGRPAVVEPYSPVGVESELGYLRVPGLHGEDGLTVYMTMSTTCAACSRAVADLRVLEQSIEADRLTLVAIPVDENDDEVALRRYSEKRDPPYVLPFDLDPDLVHRVRRVVSEALGGDGTTTPASIVTDSRGNVLSVSWSVPTLSELRRYASER